MTPKLAVESSENGALRVAAASLVGIF